MNLGNLWLWETKKLPCKFREERGNPAVDDLRERVAELAGINLSEFLEEIPTGKKNEKTRLNVKSDDVNRSAVSRKVLGESLTITLPLGAASDEMGEISPSCQRLGKEAQRTLANAKSVLALADSVPISVNKNINKMYVPGMRTLPAKLMMDVQRERVALMLSGILKTSSSVQEISSTQLRKSDVPTRNKKRRPPLSLFGQQNKSDNMSPVDFRGNLSSSALSKALDTRNRNMTENVSPLGSQDRNRLNIKFESKANLSPMSSSTSSSFNLCAGNIAEHQGAKIFFSERPVSEHKPKNILPQRVISPPNENDVERKKCTDFRMKEELALFISCASTILHWSYNEENAERLESEGAIEAMLKMCRTENLELRGICSAIFKHFTNVPLLRTHILSNARTYIPVLSELAYQCRTPEVSKNCMIAFVNITCAPGDEEQLVEDGIVTAMMKLGNDSLELVGLCMQGLYNLSSVAQPYQLIDRVLKALVSIASMSTTPYFKYICISGLSNLASFPSLQARTIEEGTILAVSSICRSTMHSNASDHGGTKDLSILCETRKVCSFLLCALTQNVQERANLANKGIIPVLCSLGNDDDPVVLGNIATSLLNLSQDISLHARMVQEGCISILCRISSMCIEFPKVTVSAAQCMSTICRLVDVSSTLQIECVHTVITLLGGSMDVCTLHHALVLLCSVLNEMPTHMLFIDNGISALKSAVLSNETDQKISYACAHVLLIVTSNDSEEIHCSLIDQGIIPVVLSLSKSNVKHKANFVPELKAITQQRCAAVLFHLARYKANVASLVLQNIVPFIIELLWTSDNSTVKYCCAGLCLVAREAENCMLIIESGAVPLIINHAISTSGDALTKRACCAFLSVLSGQHECHKQLCNCGALSALISLAQLDDAYVHLYCVIAFSNLSNNACLRETMINVGVVKVLSDLSNSYKEENQLYSAIALCNLACHCGTEQDLVNHGAIKIVMMIAMVRSVSNRTKQVCINTLLNLLTSSTLGTLLDEGLIKACTCLSKLVDEESMYSCAYMFAIISADHLGRIELCKNRCSFVAIFNLMRSDDQRTKILVGKSVNNLISCTTTRTAALESGALSTLIALGQIEDSQLQIEVASNLYLITSTCNDSMWEEILHSNCISTITLLCESSEAFASWISLRTLNILAWYENVRSTLPSMCIAKTISSIISLYEKVDQEVGNSLEFYAPDLSVCTAILCLLSLHSQHIEFILQADCINALKMVLNISPTSEIEAHSASVIRLVTESHCTFCDNSPIGSNENSDASIIESITSVLAIVTSSINTDNNVLYDCAVALYKLLTMQQTRIMRDFMVNAEMTNALLHISDRCAEADSISSAVFYLFSSEPSDRLFILSNGADEIAVKLLTRHASLKGISKKIAENVVNGLYNLSHSCAKCKNILGSNKQILSILGEISKKKSTDPLVKSSMDILNKLVDMSINAGIEEGAVSALILRSLGASSHENGEKAKFFSDDIRRGSHIMIAVHHFPVIEPINVQRFKPSYLMNSKTSEMYSTAKPILFTKILCEEHIESDASLSAIPLVDIDNKDGVEKLNKFNFNDIFEDKPGIQFKNNDVDEDSSIRTPQKNTEAIPPFSKLPLQVEYMHTNDADELKLMMARVLLYQEKQAKKTGLSAEKQPQKNKLFQPEKLLYRKCSSNPDESGRKPSVVVDNRSTTAESMRPKKTQSNKQFLKLKLTQCDRGEKLSPSFRKQAALLGLYT